MLEWDIIERSNTAYCSLLVTAVKKHGFVRPCLDERRLNKVMIPDPEFSRSIEDILHTLPKGGLKFALDLSSTYWKILLRPKHRKYRAFLHSTKCYKYKVLPVGLKTAVSWFSRAMDIILREYWKFLISYIDDMVIICKLFLQHLRHLERVFNRLRHARLTIWLKTCNFWVRKLNYLGYDHQSDRHHPSSS